MTRTRSTPLPSSVRPGRKRQAVTLSEVARAAGVAVMTVSRALNTPEAVSPELRARIHEAVAQLGYIPDRLAGSLARGSGGVIPVLIPTLHHSVHVPTLDALHDTLAAAGYHTMLGTTEYDVAREEELVRALLGWRPDGIILSGIDHSEATVRMVQSAGVPVMELLDLSPRPLDLNVGFDHAAVGRAVARELIGRGRRQVAYAGSMTDSDPRSVRRMTAFQATLAGAGLRADLVAHRETPSSITVGGELLSELLLRHPEIDAVFMVNDDLAAGALFEAQRRGIRVPQDLAICGFNDQDIAANLNPPISTVRTPRAEMGRVAAEMLLSSLRGAAVAEKSVDLGFEIIHRQTT
ncbi:LacI family DNA-binding transcriptional regulator [Deinococcus marmoris]|uniref:LacI family DNA-binding transcriptional regulator n=1 Tax=Deinococcus marmoris TaxID=249408 RepID=UPI001FE10D12|nr:LacI family DNA-binding transcriptional regulator [Deinococcus marmoris]